MFYTAPSGRIKDSYTLYHNGTYYMFSMYSPSGSEEDYTAVWLACSCDGVHYSDVGMVIQAPFKIWAMSVVPVQGKFLLNHGTFAPDGSQSVIRFWESEDLVHWRCLPELDLRPDTRFCPADSRLDCMDIVPVNEDGATVYYGFATGICGLFRSTDARHWECLGEVVTDWRPFLPPLSACNGDVEVGGCRKIGNYWYLLGGCFNHLGMSGYGTCVMRADSPYGPFRPDGARCRLYGGSGRWVSFWGRFCDTPECLLVSNSYIYTGYSYENGETWLPPLKRLMTDTDEHIYLAYWQGNDAVKGREFAELEPVTLKAVAQNVFNGASIGQGMVLTPVSAVADPEKGFVLEGRIRLETPSWTALAPFAGFYLEEGEESGTAILFSAAGVTVTGEYRRRMGEELTFCCENEVSQLNSSAAGIEISREHTFRLLVRKNMFEVYLDDRHAVTFNTAHYPGYPGKLNGRFGFAAGGGTAVFTHLQLWEMDFSATENSAAEE